GRADDQHEQDQYAGQQKKLGAYTQVLQPHRHGQTSRLKTRPMNVAVSATPTDQGGWTRSGDVPDIGSAGGTFRRPGPGEPTLAGGTSLAGEPAHAAPSGRGHRPGGRRRNRALLEDGGGIQQQDQP